jgi:5,10-methylene-tetrahydrofolate dehydrogenase/methenyl tetrahydrofolate cyclohydrolase
LGDSELRTDIELLQADGVVDGIIIQWPLPWQFPAE